MSLITLKCDSSPWANRYSKGDHGNHIPGFTAGNLLQLVFPTTPPSTLAPNQAAPPYSLPEYTAFAFAIYLTSVSHTGRVGEEPSSAFSDRSPAYVKELSGIVLVQPLFEYHNSRPPSGSPQTPSHAGTRCLYPVRTPSVTPLASRAVILLPRLRDSIVFYKNHFLTLLPYAQNPWLAYQGCRLRTPLPSGQDLTVVFQPVSHVATLA